MKTSRLPLIVGFLIIFPITVAHGEVNEICNKKTGEVRFTNVSNLPNGFSVCGALSVESYCDMYGNRLFGTPSSPPGGFHDCEDKPSIYIEKDGTPVDIAEVYRKAREAEYGYVLEQREARLQKEAEENEAKQDNGDPGVLSDAVPQFQDLNEKLKGFETKEDLSTPSLKQFTDLIRILGPLLGQ